MEEEGPLNPPKKSSNSPLQMLSKDVRQWTVEEVCDWIRTVHSNKSDGVSCSENTAAEFIEHLRRNDIDGEALIALTEKNLKEDLYLCPLGEVKRVMQAIRRIANNCNKSEDIHPCFFNNSSQSSSPHHSPITHHHHYYKSVKNLHDLDAYSPLSDEKSGDRNGGDTAKSSFSQSGSNSHRKEKRMSARSGRRYYSSDSDNDDTDVPLTQDDLTDGEQLTDHRTKRRLRDSTSMHKQYTFGKRSNGNVGTGRSNSKLQPEYLKTTISCLYMFMSTWVTAIVMVFVHDRVPDRDRHPPLPDIFLDNVPHIPWAFQLCEVTILIMTATLAVILSLHKHRCIILRRFAALSGTVFLLRCATMFITSLSVPGDHLQCSPRKQKSIWNQMEQAWIIWQGGGLSIKGVRTCGDYMFSGHTTALTMLNFFITEYTPRRMYFVHISSWVLNMFGVFFVLAAHEHYSIDVFIAFYITSRMFLYYHSLANNRALHQRDSFRTKIWFPMFGYFEANIYGIVPNEYSNLFSMKNLSWTFYNLATTPWLFILARVKLTLVALSGVTSRQYISVGLGSPPTDGGQTVSKYLSI